jgi:hypothetical protein
MQLLAASPEGYRRYWERNLRQRSIHADYRKMATYLITVRESERSVLGLRLLPGIRPSEWNDRPAIKEMTQGSSLELRFPDGTTRTTSLCTYGISVWKDEDGSLLMREDPRDAEICLMLSEEIDSTDVPAGTEVWLLD